MTTINKNVTGLGRKLDFRQASLRASPVRRGDLIIIGGPWGRPVLVTRSSSWARNQGSAIFSHLSISSVKQSCESATKGSTNRNNRHFVVARCDSPKFLSGFASCAPRGVQPEILVENPSKSRKLWAQNPEIPHCRGRKSLLAYRSSKKSIQESMNGGRQ